jgi:hypothetical protein
VSSRTHSHPKEEDHVDEGTEVEGGSGQEGKKNEHFNTIWTMFPTKQEWRVKEKASTLALTSSSDDMDVLDGDESPLIKDVSTAYRHGHQHMVFTLPTEFRGAE